MLGILSWAAANWRGVALIVVAAAIAWGAATVTKKFDRAAQADAVESKARSDVATALAATSAAEARVTALRTFIQKTDEERTAIDRSVHEREEGYVSIIATLKQRAAAASPRGSNCSYGPDARSVLDDAWHGRAGPAAPMPAGAVPPH